MYIEPAAFRAPSAESLAATDTPTQIWTQCLPSPLFAGKKAPLKTFDEIQPLIQQARKRELKLLIRENSWPINSPVRASLWPALCRQHQHGKSMLDGFYWDMVTQVSDLSNYATASSRDRIFSFKVCESIALYVKKFVLSHKVTIIRGVISRNRRAVCIPRLRLFTLRNAA
ncbi:hypothetical protein O3G_MSEX000994 [Manduca sexta]|nr:hypothetical protein O3G_MSEX000994 [Manduca sexta]